MFSPSTTPFMPSDRLATKCTFVSSNFWCLNSTLQLNSLAMSSRASFSVTLSKYMYPSRHEVYGVMSTSITVSFPSVENPSCCPGFIIRLSPPADTLTLHDTNDTLSKGVPSATMLNSVPSTFVCKVAVRTTKGLSGFFATTK